jgi:biopolymer transport protein ExbD
MSRLRRNAKLICRIDMSAFLGIQIFLLALFLPVNVDGPWTARNKGIDLPKVNRTAAETRAIREDALFVAVTRDGTVWFDQNKVRIADLHAKIRDRLIQGAEPKIYLRADRYARYANVEDVLDVNRASGVEDIAVISEERQPRPSAN